MRQRDEGRALALHWHNKMTRALFEAIKTNAPKNFKDALAQGIRDLNKILWPEGVRQ